MGKQQKRRRRRLILLALVIVAAAVWFFGNDFRFPVRGIDISHHQGEIDWDKVGGTGISFVFMKATEGQEMVDDRFKYNWAEAKRVGLKRGAYHFYLPSVDPEKQADNFIRTVTMEKGDLPPVLDIEVTRKKSKAEVSQGALIWLRKVEAHFGIRPLIYASPSFYNDFLTEDFDKYPLWLAHYYRFSPRPPRRHKEWSFWQHTNFGFISGVKGRVDRNYFSGNEADLNALTLK